MRTYRSINMAGAGDFIASVTGATGDYDITLDNGFTLTAYDETAGTISTATPAAGDLLVFGLLTDSEIFSVANAEVIPAAQAANFFKPIDLT